MAAVTVCIDFGAQENIICHCFHIYPLYLSWSDRPAAMILVYWMLNFKSTFSLSSFTLIKRLFNSSSLSTIRMVSVVYLMLIFLPAIFFLSAMLIPACDSSSPAFHMKSESVIIQSCPTFCHPIDSSLPDSSVHGSL